MNGFIPFHVLTRVVKDIEVTMAVKMGVGALYIAYVFKKGALRPLLHSDSVVPVSP